MEQRSIAPAQQRRPSAAEVAVVIRRELSARHEALLALLPADIEVDRFIELVIGTVVDNPDLLKCSPESIVLAVREAAGFGVEPTGLFGGGYLIPRYNSRTGKTEATFMLSYRGLLDLVWRSEKVTSVDCQLVYAGDGFSMTLGTTVVVEHSPALVGERGPVVAGYMVATLKGSKRPVVVPMTKAEIDKVRDSVPNWQKGPWASWYESMALKTVLRNGMRLLPMSVQAKRYADREDRLTYEEEQQPPRRSEPPRRLSVPAPTGSQEPSGAEMYSEADSEPPPPEAPPQRPPTASRPDRAPMDGGDRACGVRPPDDDPLEMVAACTAPAGHRGPHKSPEGTWPRG